MPPSIRSNVIVHHKYRFQGTSVNYTFTQQNILNLIGLMARTTTVGGNLAQSFKLNFVEIWATSQSNNSSSITLRWASDSTIGNSTNEVSETSLSSAYPSHIVARPSPSMYQSFWQVEGNDNTKEYFTVVASTQSIIDIDVSYILFDGLGSTSVTIADATAGRIYYPSPHSSMVPVGLTGILFA